MALLRQTGERLAGIVEASPLAISLIGPADMIEMWNPAAERMYGESAEKIIGQRFQDVIAPVPGDDPEVALPLLDVVRQQGYVLGVARRRLNAHGQPIELRVSGALVHDNEMGPASVLFMAEDVTERVAIEHQLRQAQKMEAIGQLTGGVAHDFNNLLAIIGGNVELLRDTVASNPSLAGLIDDIIAAVERGGSLTHRLLAYARQQQLAPTLVDVEQLVMALSGVLRRLMEESIQIDTNAASDLWKCRIDAHQLENALLNLAVNARDAMPDGGRLSIAVENAKLDEHYAGQYAEVSAGAYVLVSVSDTGIGMPKEVIERALEPFFTTKPVGRGTGLGLSMVYGFVKQSGGHMKIYSEPGRGTTVKLYLPKADSMTVEPYAIDVDTPTTHAANNRLILIVEDDDSVRRLQLRVLASLGYRTLEAADGPAGLASLDAHPDIDLLLTDVVLPKGMTGNAVARAARAKRPELKVVFMSGYATNAVIRGDELSGEIVLSKPFTRSTLANALRQAFERGR
jgi:PAS domain S-box-containing protein